MGTFLLIVVLLLAALLLIAAEVCTPTFGVLAVGALGCLGCAVWLCFTVSSVLGIVMIVVLVFLVPAYLWVVVKYLPSTAIGRILQLGAEPKPAGEGTPEAAEQQAVVGRTATAETLLRPSGTIRIDGRRYVATAESGFIEKGAAVTVIRAVGMNVVVRKADQAP